MQNTNYDLITSGSDAQSLFSQIAEVLCPPSVEETVVDASVSDIGHILLQLTEAVAKAKNEAEQERSLRVALELENEVMRAKQEMLSSSQASPSIDTSVFYNSDYSMSTRVSSVDSLTIDASLTLSECLSFCSLVNRQDLVYISYYNSGYEDLTASSVDRIYKPSDFAELMFVIFNPTVAVVPSGLIPFTVESLETLLTSSTPLDESSDEPPRMNLLEALNVQSDEDCGRIVTVRKCHKLGFKSHIHLRQYFSRFGRVDRVVLLPMRAKPKHAMDGRGNRPSSMGFVVMDTKDGADRILSYNNFCGIHEIKGWPIEVRNFVKPADKAVIDRDISGASTGAASDFAW